MRIATFRSNGVRLVGQVSSDGLHITPMSLSREEAERGALAVIDPKKGAGLATTVGKPLPIASVTLEAPIPVPRRNLFCVGRNYQSHAKELSGSIFKEAPDSTPKWPIVFTTVPETVVGPFSDVMLPSHVSTQIDYEAELTIVIGTGGRDITRAEALKHVYGYTIVNDVTARDVQMRHQQWDLGKSFDTFCPMGPWIVTADEFDGANTRMRLWVNDELRQDALTADLIFDIPTLIETCSRGITLYPGDIIATGTPAGVGMGMKPPSYLKSGDLVRIEIEGLGSICNRFV